MRISVKAAGTARFRLRGRRAFAATEFALLAPVLGVMLIGVFEIAKATILWEQVWAASRSIVVSASTLSLQPDQTTTLTVAQVQQSLSIVFAEIPWIRDGIEQGHRSATLSSIDFPASPPGCTTGCTYAPVVRWSVQYKYHNFDQGSPVTNGQGATYNSILRPCNVTLRQITPDQRGSLLTLPTAGVSKPDSILVADVHYQYTPAFFRFISGPVDFWASTYWSVRVAKPDTTINNYTTYDLANQAGGGGKC